MSRWSFPSQNFLFATCITSISLFAALQGENLPPEKVLQVKRISEYWKDKDYKRAKKNIVEFLAVTSESPVHDQLYAMLGDLCFLENNYSDAIDAYTHVKDDSLKLKVCKNLLQSYFTEKRYTEVSKYVKNSPEILSSQDCRLLYAESLLQLHLLSGDVQNRNNLETIKQQYLPLTSGEYKTRALKVLAFLHQSAQEYQEAASMYQSLMVALPEEEESFMMEIACLQIHYDMDNAIQGFEAIYEKNGPLASKAAYNQMILIFDKGDMDLFLEKKNQFGPKISEEQVGLCHFLQGRAYFSKQNYRESIEAFRNYFNSPNRKKNHDNTAFLTIIDSAKELHDLELFENEVRKYESEFADSKETENLLLIKAQLCLDVGQLSKAKECLDNIGYQFPSSSQYEPLYLQYAVILLQDKKWEVSHEALDKFVSTFPSSKHKTFAMQQMVECSFQLLQDSNDANREGMQKILCGDLESLLKSDLPLEKKQPYLFYLSENLFALKEYDLSKQKLTEYVATFQNSQNYSQALFLIALCDLNRNLDDEFTSSAHKAISETKDLLQKEFLYLQLYNIYLSKQNSEKAAEALYECYELSPQAIQMENLCWLAEYYGENAIHTMNENDINRATNIFTSLMKLLSQDNSHLEIEAIRYTQLLDAQGKLDEKLLLLQKLHTMQLENPQAWKQQNQTLLELARTYQKLGDEAQATALYDKLSNSDSPYHSSIAMLEKCQMMLKKMQESLSDEDAQTSQILDNLKDLQIKKHLSTEPIHLEAALSYAELRVRIAAEEKREKEALFFLGRLMEDFQSEDYLKTGDQFPSQIEIYRAYMDYVELEINRVKAEIAKKENLVEEMQQLQMEARAKLDKLSQQKIPSYLKERLRKIDQTL